ncbi:MAG: DUF1513 domain-containing protein [Geminicoccaceae bacterium]|nr:DUF1513 domain-containing protein [Geminicoccaceae bacterium]
MDPSPTIDRRRLIAGLALGTLAPAGLRAAAARGSAGPLFVHCAKAGEGDGDFRVAGFDVRGDRRFTLPLPDRGHSIAFHPLRPHCVVFARRPGTFAVVVDHRTGVALRRIDPVAGRHFYGHGAFSADGGVLFASENAFEEGRGEIGIYDVGDGYRRVDGFASHGVGPHDLRLAPDGRSLLVANGGIRTHPDYGRLKLNLDDMKPSLALVDAASGRSIAEARLPADLHKLSIRHLAFGAGGLAAVAMQDEEERAPPRPLVGLWSGDDIRLLDMPDELLARMRRYTGSTALAAGGEVIAVSAPKGDLVAFWDVASREEPRFIGHLDIEDGCGVAPDGSAAGFVVTSGDGTILRHDPRTRTTQRIAAPGDFAWDNHAMARLDSV